MAYSQLIFYMKRSCKLDYMFKMEILLTNAYTYLDKKSKLFETNSIAIGTQELYKRKIYVKKRHFFTKWYFVNKSKFINKMNGGYKMI